jgi:hypothetical protein
LVAGQYELALHQRAAVRHASVAELTAKLPQLPEDSSFGADIDEAHRVLLESRTTREERQAALLRWLGSSQPCLFARLAAKEPRGLNASKGLSFDIVWLDDGDIDQGDEHLRTVIQQGRVAWKDRAERGDTSAFLIVFNSRRLAYAAPGEDLVELSLRLAELYLVEVPRIAADSVYTEAVPLRDNAGRLGLFKASTQLFYSSAHLMRNHDRRVPGGLLFSVVSPGHYARSLVLRGLADDHEKAVDFVRLTAHRSVGNGGFHHPARLSSSWHNPAPDSCPIGDSPRVRSRFIDPDLFSATYQPDVLVPREVMSDGEPRLSEHRPEDVWNSLHLEYISTKPTPPGDPDFGWFNEMPIDDCAKYHNPWSPRQAENSRDFNY